MERLRILIVDDEKRIRSSVKHVLQLHYPSAEVIGEAENITEAKRLIQEKKIDVMLLDVKMPGGTGFDLIRDVLPVRFKIIFITAFSDYAIEAFKYNALDYLLKPVIPTELVLALDKAAKGLQLEMENEKLKKLLNVTKYDEKKIVLNTREKTYVIEFNKIIRCEADRNYTRFYILNEKPILISGGLKEYENELNDAIFFRPHHSHLINVLFIKELEKKEGSFLIMKDGSKVPVSVRKHAELKEVIKNL